MANLSKVIYINEEDYSTLLNGGTITKGGVTYSHDPTALYVIKNVSAPEYAETAGYATTAGQATKATQDGGGNVISETYAKKAVIGTLTNSNNVWSCDKTHEELTNAILAGNLVYLTAPGWSNQLYYPKRYPYPDGNGDYSGDLLFQSLESEGYCERFSIYDDNSIENEEIDLESYLSGEGYFKQRIILKLTIGNNNTLSFKDQDDQDINIDSANWLIRRSRDESDVVIQYDGLEYHKSYFYTNSSITFSSADQRNINYLIFDCSNTSTVSLVNSGSIDLSNIVRSISVPGQVKLPSNGTISLVDEFNAKEDAQKVLIRANIITGDNPTISFTDVNNNNLTHLEVHQLLENYKKDVVFYRGNLYYTLQYSSSNGREYYYQNFEGDQGTFHYFFIYWDSTNNTFSVEVEDINYTPTSRKINNNPLSSDITLTASDVGALPSNTVIPDELADLSDDSTHRLVTDAEKSTWSGKQDALVSGTNIKTIDGESLLGLGNIDTTFIVEVTYDTNTDTYRASETFANIYLAWQNGKDILCITEGYTFQLYYINALDAYFSSLISDINAYYTIHIRSNDTVYTSSEQFVQLANDLLTTEPGQALDATQGRILKNMITAQQVRVGSVAGKLYRNNVGGTGNFSISGNSGCIPNLVAGTYQVAIYAKSSTQTYKFRFNFGSSVTYDLTATNGIISDFREITIPSDGTFSGSVVTSSGVASGTILYVVMYNYITPITTVGPTAVTNNYNDLSDKPTFKTVGGTAITGSGNIPLPTVNNGTLTIQQNEITVGTFTANQSSNTTANIYSTMFGTLGQNGFERDNYNSSTGTWAGVEVVTPNPLVTYVDILSNKLYRYNPLTSGYVELSEGDLSTITSTAITDLTDIL